MSYYLNASEIKAQVSLVTLLAKLDYHPLRRSGNEYIYLNMLRVAGPKPSFTVNDQLGVWYDSGIAKGGNIIDFGLVYWPALSFREVLQKIVEITNAPVTLPQGAAEYKRKRRHAQRVPFYHVENVKELGNNEAITAYLQSRGIWDVAKGRLKEVYYYVEDHKKLRKYFFSAGWQNESGTWEVHNKYFKGCLGFKGLTIIPGERSRLAIFVGYFDYLSWLATESKPTATVLVLNSLSLIQAGIEKGIGFQECNLYFTHDEKGQAATLAYMKAVPLSQDESSIFAGFNNYNDWLTGEPEDAVYIDDTLYQVSRHGLTLKR